MKGILFHILFFLTTLAFSQGNTSDSLFLVKSLRNTANIYNQLLGEQTTLYSGSRYPEYQFTFMENGHQFYKSPYPIKGSIIFDNILFEDIQLQFDEVSEIVILVKGNRYISLHNDRISSFKLLNDYFVFIKNNPNAKSGFYQELYNGNVKVFKKEIKSITEEVVSPREGVKRYIKTETLYFLVKNNQFFPIKKSKNILTVFQDKKPEIQSFAKKQNLSFKRNKEQFLKETSAYFDLLTNKL